jgi:hypothetical protein
LTTLLTPFHLAVSSKNSTLIYIAIDCLAKLFSYNYWEHYTSLFVGPSSAPFSPTLSPPPVPTTTTTATSRRSDEKPHVEDDTDLDSPLQPSPENLENLPLISKLIHIICTAARSDVEDKVLVQIVKALLAAVSSTSRGVQVHTGNIPLALSFRNSKLIFGGVNLADLILSLKTTLQIFLRAKLAGTQIVAQASLTQMIQSIFSRIPKDLGLDLAELMLLEETERRRDEGEDEQDGGVGDGDGVERGQDGEELEDSKRLSKREKGGMAASINSFYSVKSHHDLYAVHFLLKNLLVCLMELTCI